MVFLVKNKAQRPVPIAVPYKFTNIIPRAGGANKAK
jgi:hypothetical protein